MTHPHTHKEEPRSWEEEWDFLLQDYADNIYYEGDPRRSRGTAEPKLKSFVKDLLSTREKEVREEILRNLPEELIIHSYMQRQGDKSTEYCEGWNAYRLEVIKRLTPKTEIG